MNEMTTTTHGVVEFFIRAAAMLRGLEVTATAGCIPVSMGNSAAVEPLWGVNIPPVACPVRELREYNYNWYPLSQVPIGASIGRTDSSGEGTEFLRLDDDEWRVYGTPWKFKSVHTTVRTNSIGARLADAAGKTPRVYRGADGFNQLAMIGQCWIMNETTFIRTGADNWVITGPDSVYAYDIR